VTVEVAPAERGFALTVKDSGEGISPEFMPYLFDRFRQADAGSARRHGGLGLGLAIVKQLVELHGGTIEAHSEGQNQGAVFTVLLPERTVPPSAAAAPQAPVAEAAEDPEFTVEEAFLRGVRILLVDDEPDSINVARRVLEECEAHVDVAASAKEAYEQVRNKHPHIVISDIGMPIEDGYSLMQRIRQAQNGSQAIRGIALTAFARPDDRKRALDAGYTAHLTKPVDPAELIRVVAKVADRAALAVNEKNA
jgi:CheY-like chemotaxis protein